MVMWQPQRRQLSEAEEEKVFKCAESCGAQRTNREELDENFRCKDCANKRLANALSAIKPTGGIVTNVVKKAHRKPCEGCGYNGWSAGEYYVYCHLVPHEYDSKTTRKFCLSCAEEEFSENVKDATEALRQRKEALEQALQDLKHIHADMRQKVRDWLERNNVFHAGLSVEQLVAVALERVERDIQVAEALRQRKEALEQAIEDLEHIHADTRQKVRDWLERNKDDFNELSVEDLVALALERVERDIQVAESLRQRKGALEQALQDLKHLHASTKQKVRDWLDHNNDFYADLSADQLVAVAAERVELESQIEAISSGMPASMVLTQVKSPSMHKKRCSEVGCGYKGWKLGDYYVYNGESPRGTDKLCLKCAMKRYGGDPTHGLPEELLADLPSTVSRLCRQLFAHV